MRAQHALVSGRRRRRRVVRFRKERRIGPGAADAQVGRRQSGCELPQARICQVDRRPGRKQIGLPPRCFRRLHQIVPTRVGFPERPARDRDHFNVVGLKALVDRGDSRQLGRYDRQTAGGGEMAQHAEKYADTGQRLKMRANSNEKAEHGILRKNNIVAPAFRPLSHFAIAASANVIFRIIDGVSNNAHYRRNLPVIHFITAIQKNPRGKS